MCVPFFNSACERRFPIDNSSHPLPLLPSLPPSLPSFLPQLSHQIEVIVHPLVLLSTVDHYNRVAKDTRKRVVGVLLGTTWRGRIDITNSFAGREGRKEGGREGGREEGRGRK